MFIIYDMNLLNDNRNVVNLTIFDNMTISKCIVVYISAMFIVHMTMFI